MTKFDQGKFANQNNMVSNEDVIKIFAATPFYANKFFVTIQPDGMVRMAFADGDSSALNMNVRTAVIVPYAAFVSLANLINENVQNLMKLQQSATAAQGQVMPKVN